MNQFSNLQWNTPNHFFSPFQNTSIYSKHTTVQFEPQLNWCVQIQIKKRNVTKLFQLSEHKVTCSAETGVWGTEWGTLYISLASTWFKTCLKLYALLWIWHFKSPTQSHWKGLVLRSCLTFAGTPSVCGKQRPICISQWTKSSSVLQLPSKLLWCKVSASIHSFPYINVWWVDSAAIQDLLRLNVSPCEKPLKSEEL